MEALFDILKNKKLEIQENLQKGIKITLNPEVPP